MYGNQERRGVRRAHSPDIYETSHYRNDLHQQYNRGGHFNQGGRGGYNKRHKGDQPSLTIEEKIARLGEVGSRNSDIGTLAKDIDIDLTNKSQSEDKVVALTTKICCCIISFPTKIGTYATLIGLISVKHYNIACQIINTLHASYQVYLEAQKWQDALTIMHLLSSLVNCKVIHPNALMSQFEFLLECTVDQSIPQARSDYFVYTVLSSLPYVALELSQAETSEASQSEPLESGTTNTSEVPKKRTSAKLEQILSTIETYLSKRSKEHLNKIRIWISSESTVQMDYLDSLWVQMKNFRANDWVEHFLHRPYNDKENKEIMESSLIPTNSPTFQIPCHSDSYVYPYPRIVLRLFEDDTSDGSRNIPGSDKIERFCIENHIRSIIDEISTDPRDCARRLCYMYRSDSIPIKHLLIEVVLGELFRLPTPKHPEIFYHSILYELSKILHPSKNPDDLKCNYDVILNDAVRNLFENLETMNVTCFSRFVSWFSFHLNNTEYVFPWQTWADATSKDSTSKQTVFVQDILDHCVRFSFHKKIGTLVQADLSNLMPTEVCVQYKPIFEENPGADTWKETIRRLIVGKADGPSICLALNIIIDGVELPEDFSLRDEKVAEQMLKIDIFTAVILDMASKSLTHLSSAIGKFRNVFRSLTRIPNGRIQLLQTMHSCLVAHPQLQVILVDKLLKADLVEPNEVCSWIFSDLMKPYHLKSYPWEILNNTIARAYQTVENLIAERDDLKVAIEEANTATANKNGSEEGDVDMTPSEEVEQKRDSIKKEKEAVDDKIELARKVANELALQVFRVYTHVLGEHVRNSPKPDAYFIWMSGRMQEVYYRHIAKLQTSYGQIKTIVNTVPSVSDSIINLNQ